MLKAMSPRQDQGELLEAIPGAENELGLPYGSLESLPSAHQHPVTHDLQGQESPAYGGAGEPSYNRTAKQLHRPLNSPFSPFQSWHDILCKGQLL